MIVTTDNAHYAAIANAIRTQNGESTTYQPAEMAPAILAIGGGGSGAKKDVNFYDFNGTFVAGYLLSELPLAELPTPPDHSGHAVPLTFQSWNYTLSQVNALTQKQDIGAVYVPTDGKTHIRYTITTVTGGNPTLTINNTGGGTLTVNWGDGSAAQTDSGTGNKAFTPVSAIANGSYDLTVSSTAAYAMPTLTESTYIFGSAVYNQCITAAYLGDSVTSIGDGAFGGCVSLTSITIPDSVTSIGDDAFFGCSSLASITIPNGVTSIGDGAFDACSSLASITIPDSVTSIGDGAFGGCVSLTSITIPDSVTSIGAYVFGGCVSLTSITIPDSVTSIGEGAFVGCSSLVEYDFSAFTSVPTLEDTDVFSNTNAICIMKIPAALYDTWTTEANWVTYANYMVAV